MDVPQRPCKVLMYMTRGIESTEPTGESIGVDLEKFERGLPWRLQMK